MSKIDTYKYCARALAIVGFCIIIICASTLPFNDWSWKSNAELFSQYGNFIGGLVGSLFSLAGFFLLYETLTAQRQALEQEKHKNETEILLALKKDFENELSCLTFTLNKSRVEGLNVLFLVRDIQEKISEKDIEQIRSDSNIGKTTKFVIKHSYESSVSFFKYNKSSRIPEDLKKMFSVSMEPYYNLICDALESLSFVTDDDELNQEIKRYKNNKNELFI